MLFCFGPSHASRMISTRRYLQLSTLSISLRLAAWQCPLNYFRKHAQYCAFTEATNRILLKTPFRFLKMDLRDDGNCPTRVWGRPPAGPPHGPHGAMAMGRMGPWVHIYICVFLCVFFYGGWAYLNGRGHMFGSRMLVSCLSHQRL